MKQQVLLALMMTTGLTVFAQSPAPTAKITRFYYSNNESRSNVAELCGKVENMIQFPTYVKILSDERRPYTVVADKSGIFCETITTYTGVAAVEVIDSNAIVP